MPCVRTYASNIAAVGAFGCLACSGLLRCGSDLMAEASPGVAGKRVVSRAGYDADGTQFGMKTAVADYVALEARRWG